MNVARASQEINSQTNAGSGNGGTVAVRAGHVEVRNGGAIASSTFSAGNAGSVLVEADRLLISGDGAVGLTGIASRALPGAKGQGGKVSVIAGELKLQGGGVIGAETFAAGGAGVVSVDADHLLISDAAITSQANRGSTGQAGKVTVSSSTAELHSGGQIASTTFGPGNAGDVRIDADRLFISGDNAQVLTGVTTQANRGSSGDAGKVTVTADHLELLDGAKISSLTFGTGDAGSVNVEAGRLLIARTRSPSGIVSSVEPGSTGAGGNIDIRAGNIELSGQAVVNAQSASAKNAGNISITAGDTIRLQGGSRVSTLATEASGGNITLAAPHMIYLIDSQVASSVQGGAKRLGVTSPSTRSSSFSTTATSWRKLFKAKVETSTSTPISSSARRRAALTPRQS